MKTLIRFFTVIVLVSHAWMLKAQTHSADSIGFRNVQDLPYRLTYAAYTSDSHNLYAVNGVKFGDIYSSEVLKFDPATNQWSTLTDQLSPKARAVAAYVPQTNKIYVMGGQLRNNVGLFYHIEAVDVNTGKVNRLKATNPMPGISCGIAVWNNKIYLYGGSEEAGEATGTSKFYEFDPITEKFKRLHSIPQAGFTSGAVVNGILYTFGGFDGYNQSVSKKIFAYNIQTGVWKMAGKLPEYITGTAVVNWQNKIILIGAYPNQRFLGVFDTRNNQFKKLSSDMIGRRYAGAGVINNELYVFGGNQSASFPGMKSTQAANLRTVAEQAR